ncbi:copper oxidase [Xaviernesmea oryzae]|uniref:Copper oxidase n=1 Tax=Xaviernesmea oryzae TaxID=464029 RepID=A0A1Q9AXG7_9HYPH|nr:multicopper oxidase family protein [Xaviernesmea oryzae]OLP60126.1 copper oxidase [Xaviernesmea oryzae]
MMSLSRRNLLKASASLAGCAALGAGLARHAGAAPPPTPLALVAQPARMTIGSATAQSEVMTYGLGETAPSGMPPVLRMRKGEPFAARFTNRLAEPSTVHWHGLRIDNAMDGVPELTQPYVYPGDGFDYRFTPPDAGTFWYHPHCNTLEQMGRGLTGVIVVEDPADPVFDAEVVLNLRDWRLRPDGSFLEAFKPRDAARSGTFGTLRTANWRDAPMIDAPAGGLVRLRLAATDVTRIYTLGLAGADAVVLSLDGHATPRPLPLDQIDLAPGQRADLVLRMPDGEGMTVTLTNFRGSTPWTVAGLRAVGASAHRALGDVKALSPNALSPFDAGSATRIPLDFTATAEHAPSPSLCGSIGYTFWAINKVPWQGDTTDPTAPLAELKLGRSYILEMANRTPHAHPIHLHGLTFTIISSNKRDRLPPPTDTILLQPDEKAELALVADNPGDWMLHCHIIEHQKSGMSAYFRVT